MNVLTTGMQREGAPTYVPHFYFHLVCILEKRGVEGVVPAVLPVRHPLPRLRRLPVSASG